jgi:hypothetical protein
MVVLVQHHLFLVRQLLTLAAAAALTLTVGEAQTELAVLVAAEMAEMALALPGLLIPAVAAAVVLLVEARAGLVSSSFVTQIHTQPQRQQPARQQSRWPVATAYINGLAVGASPSNGFHNRRSCS